MLSGCRPEYMPVLVAALEAMADPAFTLHGSITSTGGSATLLVVNGPIRRAIGLNAGSNVFGPGWRANATIGRAIRLITLNALGALPGVLDRSTQGHPGKYTFCIAENEEESPWEPLHVERGFERGQSTVTVVGAEGTINMNTHSKEALELARVIAETMMHPPSNEYVHGGEPWLIMGPEHAEIFRRGGMSKADVKRELWERSKMAVSRLAAKEIERARDSRTAELGELHGEMLLPISSTADEVMLIVAGGAGTHSVYVPCFGNSRAITREIDL